MTRYLLANLAGALLLLFGGVGALVCASQLLDGWQFGALVSLLAVAAGVPLARIAPREGDRW